MSKTLEEDSTLLEYAYSYGVALVSPTSLLALLRSFTSLWSASSATEEAEKVVELGKTLVSRLASFMKHMDALGKSLSSAVSSYNKALGSLETRVLTTARNLSSLECSIDSPTPIEASLRIRSSTQEDLP
ncbi:DNA recombination protein RmuC [Actinotignum urinale]|uniref:DNA recombination protein RmuC n=1 Tax=Actinotignum urinale TaxID=190146 RepID=UPI002A805666|nr:DNA recombination protein RmuC [Actinotignum urinale]MDY5128645.1 DNA recombination protein RmuC [Actinotignum urinale]